MFFSFLPNPKKVAYLKAEIPWFQKFFTYCPTAQMAEFMFPNVVYRATVYRTGVSTLHIGYK